MNPKELLLAVFIIAVFLSVIEIRDSNGFLLPLAGKCQRQDLESIIYFKVQRFDAKQSSNYWIKRKTDRFERFKERKDYSLTKQSLMYIKKLLLKIDKTFDALIHLLPMASAASTKFHSSRILYIARPQKKFLFKNEYPAQIDLSQYFQTTRGFEKYKYRVFMVKKGKEKDLPNDYEIDEQDLSSDLPCFVTLDG